MIAKGSNWLSLSVNDTGNRSERKKRFSDEKQDPSNHQLLLIQVGDGSLSREDHLYTKTPNVLRAIFWLDIPETSPQGTFHPYFIFSQAKNKIR